MTDATFAFVNARQSIPQKPSFDDDKSYKRADYKNDDVSEKDDVDNKEDTQDLSTVETTDFLALMLSQIEPGAQTTTNSSASLGTSIEAPTTQQNNAQNNALSQTGIQAGLVIAQEAINQNTGIVSPLVTPTTNTDASLITVTPIDAKTTASQPVINAAQNALVKDGIKNTGETAQTPTNANTVNNVFSQLVNGETPILENAVDIYEWRSSIQGATTSSNQNSNSLITAQLFGGTDTGMNNAASLVANVAQNNANTTQNSLSGTDLAMISSADGISIDGFEMSNGGDFGQGFNDSDAETLFMTKDLAASRATASGTPTAAQSFASHITQAKAPGYTSAPSEQVMMQLQKGVEGKLEKISLQLDPASLGKVDIEFDIAEDGRVKAVIRAERPETLELLKQDSSSIQALLEEAGLETAEDGLAFDLRQQNDEGRETDKNKNNSDDFSLDDEVMTSAVETQEIQMQTSSLGVLSATQVNIVV